MRGGPEAAYAADGERATTVATRAERKNEPAEALHVHDHRTRVSDTSLHLPPCALENPDLIPSMHTVRRREQSALG